MEFTQIMIKLQEWGMLYGLKIIAALAILIIGQFVAKGIRALVTKALRQGKIDETLVAFISSLAQVAIMAFVIVAALGQLGVETASFVAILGAAGLAIGLALQGSLSNFAAGIMMIVFKPFKVGDYIQAAGAEGTVEMIGIFTTDLKTNDNKKIIVPNAKLLNDNIVNFTANNLRRVDITIGVGYKEGIDSVKRALDSIIHSDTRILKDPSATVGILELGEKNIKFTVRSWVKTNDYWSVFFDMQENIKKRFDAAGINLEPQPQEVYLQKTDSSVNQDVKKVQPERQL